MSEIVMVVLVYLAAAVLFVPISVRIGLGSVLGYLAAGLAVGPGLGLIGSEVEEIQHVAEFGVVMMLFLIGLELDPSGLWNMRHRLVGLGGLQIGLTTAAITGLGLAFDLEWPVALATGSALALSSTAIVLQTVSEKGLMQSRGGRSAFSVLLAQDIAVIPILALLPLAAFVQATAPGTDAYPLPSTADITEHAAGAPSLLQGLGPWTMTAVTIATVAAVLLAGIYLARPLFHFVHRAYLREMSTALALLIVLGIAFVMTMVNLPPALGAFLAGVVLASSEFRHQLESDIEPFKGLLLGLFFVTVGASMDIPLLLDRPLDFAGLTLAVIILKGGILFALGRLFGLKRRDLWLFSLGLAQAGEFGFVLIALGVQQHVFPGPLGNTLFLIIALSMLATPLLFLIYEQMARRFSDDPAPRDSDRIDVNAPVIIAGVGRFGQVVNRLVRSAGIETVVLDKDLATIETMRRFGARGYFGDPSRPDLLNAAGLKQARVLAVCLDDTDDAVRIITHARQLRPDLHIVARAYDRRAVFRLFRAGANDIVRELFGSSLRSARYVLENAGMSQNEARVAADTYFRHDCTALRELAEVWDPEISLDQNKAYIARSMELAQQLEASLLAQVERRRAQDQDNAGQVASDVAAEAAKKTRKPQVSGRWA